MTIRPTASRRSNDVGWLFILGVMLLDACADSADPCAGKHEVKMAIPGNPSLLVLRDGDGDWESVEADGPDGGMKTAQLCVAEDYVVTVVCEQPNGSFNAYQFSGVPADGDQAAQLICNRVAPGETLAVSGHVDQAAQVQAWEVYQFDYGKGFDFKLQVLPGKHDLVVSDDFTKIPASSHKMLLQRGIDVQGMLDVGELDLSRDGAAMRSVETHVDGIDPAEPVTTTTTWRDREPVEAIVSTTSELVAKLPPSELLHSSDEVMVYVDAGMDGHLHGVAYRYEGGDRNYTVPPHLDAAFVPRAVRFAKLPASDDESFVYLAAAQRSSMARIASARWARLRDATEIGFDADVPGYQPFWDIVQPDFVEAQLITKTADVTAYAAYGTANPPTQ